VLAGDSRVRSGSENSSTNPSSTASANASGRASRRMAMGRPERERHSTNSMSVMAIPPATHDARENESRSPLKISPPSATAATRCQRLPER